MAHGSGTPRRLGPGDARGMQARAIGLGRANPPLSYTQDEILEKLGITDGRVGSVFRNSHIERRFLYLPESDPAKPEGEGDLLARHKTYGIQLALQAMEDCLAKAGAKKNEVRYLCCVTSTGWLTPGLSAFLIKQWGIPVDCGRIDVVGMGCNGGLNGLSAVVSWALSHPGEIAVLVCVEICSAAYVLDGSMSTAVVNSLFGDGAAALAVCASAESDAAPGAGPKMLEFSSRLIPEAISAMRYDWDDLQNKFSFFIDPDIPYVIGANIELAVDALLSDRLRRSEISHWLVHPGGKKVIDAVRVNLGLGTYDLRHTIAVLRRYGNLSSGSFLFAFQNLLDEGSARPGDFGVMVTMGPGSTIETALLQW